MFAEIKSVATVGAAIVGVGWVIVMGPAPANALPLPVFQDDSICPSSPGVRYVLDPNNPDAYYVCKGGSPQARKVCPLDTHPDVSTKPIDCPTDEGFEGKP